MNNGYEIPCIGFGTWQTPDGEAAVMAISEATRVGYRHIDTTARYGNEVGVGQEIKESGIEQENCLSQARPGTQSAKDMQSDESIILIHDPQAHFYIPL